MGNFPRKANVKKKRKSKSFNAALVSARCLCNSRCKGCLQIRTAFGDQRNKETKQIMYYGRNEYYPDFAIHAHTEIHHESSHVTQQRLAHWTGAYSSGKGSRTPGSTMQTDKFVLFPLFPPRQSLCFFFQSIFTAEKMIYLVNAWVISKKKLTRCNIRDDHEEKSTDH